jgi:hypothetical protein
MALTIVLTRTAMLCSVVAPVRVARDREGMGTVVER